MKTTNQLGNLMKTTNSLLSKLFSSYKKAVELLDIFLLRSEIAAGVVSILGLVILLFGFNYLHEESLQFQHFCGIALRFWAVSAILEIANLILPGGALRPSFAKCLPP